MKYKSNKSSLKRNNEVKIKKNRVVKLHKSASKQDDIMDTLKKKAFIAPTNRLVEKKPL